MILKQYLILMCVTTVPAIADKRSEDTLNCTSYGSVVETFTSCFEPESGIDLRRQIQSLFVGGNMFLSSDDIIDTVQSICSTNDIEKALTICKNNIVSQCPDLETFIADSFREKLEFFCNGNYPSLYMQSVFYDGYYFDLSCNVGNSEYFDLIRNCRETNVGKTLKNIDHWNVTYAWSMQKNAMDELFKCMAPEDVLSQERFLCNVTKGDILALYWLFLTGTKEFIVPTINEEARNKLQNAAAQKLRLDMG